MSRKITTALLCPVFMMAILSSCGSAKNTLRGGGVAKEAKEMMSPELKDSKTFLIEKVSEDDSYGYTEQNPIKVGGVGEGPANERRYLNALAGPNGETITYVRLGSCCSFESKNGFMGKGLLDRFKVTWEGQEEEVILYLNMYDFEVFKAPKGLTIK